MNGSKLQELKIWHWKDIKLWMLVFFLIRLWGISNPPLEAAHAWRQTLTNMVARNFYTDGPNVLFPKVDYTGNIGIIGTEFPLYNFLIYICFELLGFDHWYGRLINLLVTTIGILYFYRIVRKMLNKNVAFFATMMLNSSIWFSYSRKIMPDTFSMSLVMVGLYYGYSYIKKGNFWRVFGMFSFGTLGVLSKIPALSLYSLFFIPILDAKVLPKRRISLMVSFGASLTAILAWYFLWVPYLEHRYHNELYATRTLAIGLLELLDHPKQTLQQYYFHAFKSFLGFGCFLGGFWAVFRYKNTKLLRIGFPCIVIFFFFMLKAGSVFATHDYYIIPFVPFMAILGGYFLSKLQAQWAYSLLFLVCVEGIYHQRNDFVIAPSQAHYPQLEALLDQTGNKTGKLVLLAENAPQLLYFANRKGWVTTAEEANKPYGVQWYIRNGATRCVVDKNNQSDRLDNFNVLYEDQNFIIYDLETPNLPTEL